MGHVDLITTTTDNCRYCLMCRHVCPVGHVTSLETFTPHGWGLTIASQRRGMISWSAETVEVIYSCADCGACRAHCVTDQPLPDAIAAVRAEIVAQKLAPARVLELGKVLEKWGNPYCQQVPTPVEGKGEVALFVGDEANFLWPQLLEAVLKLLARVGLEPILIGKGRNSGYLASSLGYLEISKNLAQANLDELEASGASRLLVLSPGDYYTFQQLYRDRLDVTFPEDVELTEVTMFLAKQLEAGALKLQPSTDETPYAYIDPAHAVRVPARHDAPRKLLASALSAPARELFWRRERTHPVGSTALQFTRPELAEKLTQTRVQDALQAGARMLITEDAGTLHKLSDPAKQQDLRVQGLFELLTAQLA